MQDYMVVCDVDDTLIMYDLSEYEEELTTHIKNPYSDMELSVVPNMKNINTLIKFKKLGYQVIVWSRTGKLWAQAVVDALELGSYVDMTLAKPLYYIDDKEAHEWIGEKVWRDPNSRYGG